MQQSRWFTLATTTALALGTLLSSACGSFLSRPYCDQAASCDNDPGFLLLVGLTGSGDAEDSPGVCAAKIDTVIASLRTNDEQVCQDIAIATEALMQCVIDEGCDGFDIFSNPCQDELDRVSELRNDAGGLCNE